MPDDADEACFLKVYEYNPQHCEFFSMKSIV
jgi:hypothetical protein